MAATRMKVIVADDEEVIANSLAAILKQAGFDARAVYSGEMAVEMARELPTRYADLRRFHDGYYRHRCRDSGSCNAAVLPNSALLRAATGGRDLTQGEFDVLRKPIASCRFAGKTLHRDVCRFSRVETKRLRKQNLNEFTELALRVCASSHCTREIERHSRGECRCKRQWPQSR